MPMIKKTGRDQKHMKRLILCLLLIGSAARATTFAFVQSKSQSVNTALAFTSNNTAGNMIIFWCSSNSVTAVTDTRGNTYVKLAGSTAGSTIQSARTETSIFAAFNIAAGANSVTPTGMAANGSFANMAIAEYVVFTSLNVGAGLNDTTAMSIGQIGASETLIVLGAQDFHSNHGWTGTNITVREQMHDSNGSCAGYGDTVASTVAAGTAHSLDSCSQTDSCLSSGATFFQAGGGGGGAGPASSAFVGAVREPTERKKSKGAISRVQSRPLDSARERNGAGPIYTPEYQR